VPRDPWRSFGPVAAGAGAERVKKTLGNITDYLDENSRNGYSPDFIPGLTLPLPGLGAWEEDAAEVDPLARESDDPHELRYRNFSVKMSMSRRMPLFSAVNIDGAQSVRSMPRTNVWKFDPRIDPKFQIVEGVYGNESQGLFSRGHMTRREDPNWGEDLAILKQADADTFHATNAAPQRQGFNAGVWLALENYVLNNTDDEQIRATVVTGPVFGDDDPEYAGVRVPIEFWKIVVFVHPVLKEPKAIGYKRSQAKYLPQRARAASRFVFGNFEDTQVSIASIGEDTGLDFSAYVDLDVLKAAGAQVSVRLATVEDAFLTP
jgi:endonuclease G